MAKESEAVNQESKELAEEISEENNGEKHLASAAAALKATASKSVSMAGSGSKWQCGEITSAWPRGGKGGSSWRKCGSEKRHHRRQSKQRQRLKAA